MEELRVRSRERARRGLLSTRAVSNEIGGQSETSSEYEQCGRPRDEASFSVTVKCYGEVLR